MVLRNRVGERRGWVDSSSREIKYGYHLVLVLRPVKRGLRGKFWYPQISLAFCPNSGCEHPQLVSFSVSYPVANRGENGWSTRRFMANYGWQNVSEGTQTPKQQIWSLRQAWPHWLQFPGS